MKNDKVCISGYKEVMIHETEGNGQYMKGYMKLKGMVNTIHERLHEGIKQC